MYSLLNGCISALFALISLYDIHWTLALLTATEVIIMLNLPKLMDKRLISVSQNIALGNEAFTTQVTDELNAYETYFTSRRFNRFKEMLDRSFESIGLIQEKYDFEMNHVAILGGIGNVVSQVANFIYVGYLALNQVVLPGALGATIGLSVEIFNVIGNLGQYLQMIKSTQPIFEKFKLLEKFTKNASEIKVENNSIKLKDLAFTYDDKEVFANVNYHFKPNKKYAIVGSSGSGKSTLFKLLSQMELPNRNQIFIDD